MFIEVGHTLNNNNFDIGNNADLFYNYYRYYRSRKYFYLR